MATAISGPTTRAELRWATDKVAVDLDWHLPLDGTIWYDDVMVSTAHAMAVAVVGCACTWQSQ